MSGAFSLFKYFKAYCEIKSKASTQQNLEQYGPFDDCEFIIYTNVRMVINSALKVEDCELSSILN
jgi:hypothetical protein